MLAKEYGRYGYRTVTDLMRQEGWDVGKDRVYTIWRQEGQRWPQLFGQNVLFVKWSLAVF